jgi:hypothetical protein
MICKTCILSDEQKEWLLAIHISIRLWNNIASYNHQWIEYRFAEVIGLPWMEQLRNY